MTRGDDSSLKLGGGGDSVHVFIKIFTILRMSEHSAVIIWGGGGGGMQGPLQNIGGDSPLMTAEVRS